MIEDSRVVFGTPDSEFFDTATLQQFGTPESRPSRTLSSFKVGLLLPTVLNIDYTTADRFEAPCFAARIAADFTIDGRWVKELSILDWPDRQVQRVKILEECEKKLKDKVTH